jgi:outer membrane protein assembly factor BamB
MVTSSAWFEPGDGTRPDLVLFGGGFTLYALNARTGALYWKHAYTGRPDLPPDPAHDEARIFSSPVVVDGKVIVGVSTDGQRQHRGSIVAADLADGSPLWTLETDLDAAGQVTNDGCGNVWSSGTVLPKAQTVVFDVADCQFSDPGPLTESVVAVNAVDGTPAWTFKPPRRDDHCDFDFGATANAGTTPGGVAKFLGVGGKDGTYYSLDPSSGTLRWSTNVVFGGFTGGFIATTAFDGNRIYGSTAIGDFGHFESNGPQVCDPSDPRDTPIQEPTVHILDARSGNVLSEANAGASFAPTTIAGSMTFNCPALRPTVDVRDATSGTLLTTLPQTTPCWSGIATVGNALVFGLGTSFSRAGNGIAVYTPDGAAPQTPSH